MIAHFARIILLKQRKHLSYLFNFEDIKMSKRTTEKDLIAPSVVVLLKNTDEKGYIKSSVFREEVLKLIRPKLTVMDKSHLPSRPVSRIQQTLMNMVSHRVLEKEGLATYIPSKGMFKVRAKTKNVAMKMLTEGFKV